MNNVDKLGLALFLKDVLTLTLKKNKNKQTKKNTGINIYSTHNYHLKTYKNNDFLYKEEKMFLRIIILLSTHTFSFYGCNTGCKKLSTINYLLGIAYKKKIIGWITRKFYDVYY